MGSLSDVGIKKILEAGILEVDPFDPSMIQPASLDLRLGDSFRIFHNHRAECIDLRNVAEGLTEEVTIAGDEPFIIHPGEFCLGTTFEKITLGDNLLARVEGRSSLGRLGLLVHATAGFIDPGFSGNITLEFANLTRLPIKLYQGLGIAQLSFDLLDQAAERPYGHAELRSKYQGQSGATASKYRG